MIEVEIPGKMGRGREKHKHGKRVLITNILWLKCKFIEGKVTDKTESLIS